MQETQTAKLKCKIYEISESKLDRIKNRAKTESMFFNFN